MPAADMRVVFATAFVSSVLGLLVGSLFVVSFLFSTLLGFPPSLAVPPVMRAVGIVLLAGGLVMAGWLVRYRGFASMVLSTRTTFEKMFMGIPIAGRGGREEPLLVSGPQRYVRHPLYSGALAMVLGWGLFVGSTLDLVATVAILLWFILVQIPFEERELRSLFGDQYAEYSRETPMLVPFAKVRLHTS